jgi:hypothetical protein
LKEFVAYSIAKIKKTEIRKNKEHNLKRKHLAPIHPEFKPDDFDDVEDYEIKWIKIYNENKVKNKFQERKTNTGKVSSPPQIIEKGYSVNKYI